MKIISSKSRLNSFAQEKFFPFFRQLFGVLEVVFYTTLPTIILVLFSIIDKKISFCDTINTCYTHGEFLLYSIALLSSAYTTMKVYSKNPNNTSLIIILIIVVSILYAITIKTTDKDLDVMSLLGISVIASLFSFHFTWRAMSLKNGPIEKSFPERDKNATDNIQNGLNYDE